MKKYTEEYRIELNDCNENERLKIPTMIDLMMQVSEHQLEKGGAGTEDLIKRGLGWVVTQYHFDIKKMPAAGDLVKVSTIASGYNKFFEYRDFFIEDEAGNRIVDVKSQWVMFDLKKRKLVPCDVELVQKFNVPELKKMPRFPKLRPQDSYSAERQYRVRFDDLDTNHHLTNSHYFNWFIDMLDRDFLKDHVVKTIDIKFNKEVQYGQMPYSCLDLIKNDDKIISYHAIKDLDKKDQTICELEWRRI